MSWAGLQAKGWRAIAVGCIIAGMFLVFNGQIPYGPLWGICCLLGGLAQLV